MNAESNLGKRCLEDKVDEIEERVEPKAKKEKLEMKFSHISEKLDKNVGYVAGIDEAGRGPVLGPMVYSIAFYPIEEQDKRLRKIGFNDSKQLSEAQRDFLFEKIHQHDVGFIVDPLSAEGLSHDMLRINRRNLNRISHDSAIGLIGQVMKMGFKLKEVFVDTVGKPEVYQKILQEQFPSIPSIVVSKKADSIYPIVGAASICAKVIRDKLVADWQFKENLPTMNRSFGSGYPGDQNTKNWLLDTRQHVFGYPTIVRYSWSTTTTLLQEAASVHWSFEDIQAFEEINAHSRMSETKRESLQEASNRAQQNKTRQMHLQKRYKFFASNGMSRLTNAL